MKRCKRAFILLTASLFLAVCVPGESRAEEGQDKTCVEQGNQAEMSLEEMFADVVCTFEAVIERLYKESGTVEALQNLEKGVQKDFYDKIGRDNQYKFTLFYKYTLLWASINGKEEWNTAEELDEALKCYEMLVLWRDEKNVMENNHMEDQLRAWEEKNSDRGFQSYVEYLQNMTEVDAKELLKLLGGIEEATNVEDRARASEKVKKYIYNLHGGEAVTEKDTEEKEIISGQGGSKEGEVTEDTQEENGEIKPEIMTMAGAAEVRALYKPYGQVYGWKDWVSGGIDAGSPGERKRIEALQIKIAGGNGFGITYQAYVQGKGWMNWVNDGETSGTEGQGLRLEAFRAKLTGANTADYDLYYRAYCEGYGWLGWAKDGQTAGTACFSKAMYAFQVVVVPAGLPAPGPTSSPLQTDAVARVGSTYYTTFDGAFSAVPDGGTMYVIRDCTAGHNVTTKSFTIYPEEQDVVVTANSNLGKEPAGIIAAPQSTPEDKTGTWTLSGMDGYTLTIDGNRKCSSGILASSCKITMNLKSGVRLRNGIANGIWNGWGTTNVYDDVMVYGNHHAGITTWGGTVNIYGGDIYSNSITGVRGRIIHMSGGEVHHNGYVGIEAQGAVSNTAITITGGSIYSNAVDGVTAYAANGVCTTNISGGEIYSNNSAGVRSAAPSGTLILSNHPRIFKNEIGIVTEATTTLTGGVVYENRGGGIRTSKSFTISGGAIYSNKTEQNGGGIYNSGILTLSGGEVYSNSAVFGGGIYNLGTLSVNGGSISRNNSTLGRGVYQGGIMNMSGGAWIDGSNDIYLPETRNIVTVTGALTSGRTAALITPSSYILGRTCVRAAYKGAKGSEVYQKFALTPNSPYLLRPGDYQSEGEAADTDAVISREYPIYYKKNYDDDTIQVPKDSNKFWYESARISGQIPSFGSIEFKGWAENPDAKEAKYQPGDTIHAANNKGITLYAVWKTEIKVAYIGNSADSGHPRSEYVTLKQCRENNGYEIKKNTGYTNFSRKGYAFAGWGNNKWKTSIKDVSYPENQKNKITFEELYETAKEQQKNTASGSAIPEMELYSMWDEAPKISADDNLEFYEGTEVTKKMLLSNIKAFDKEDGDSTKNVRIIRIRYADGRLLDGEKQEGTVDVWEKDMPEEYKLDTWFLQLDKEESPAVHKITYAVTDSAGTETTLEWEVKVKYNEFPVIEAEDWYFTLEEAQNGVITEDVLVKTALENGRLKVEDKEDDVLYPGSIRQNVKLADFHPGEFTEFNVSGYIVLTYSVQDSMGPEGEGKETLFQVTVHVVEDGEIIKPEPAKYVRFINKENYQKNVGIETETLDSSEKERLNQNGGLNVDSKWYEDSSYKSLISSIWSEEKTPDKVWCFSCKDVQKVKEYINIYGIGNSQEEGALNKFLEKFPFFVQE